MTKTEDQLLTVVVCENVPFFFYSFTSSPVDGIIAVLFFFLERCMLYYSVKLCTKVCVNRSSMFSLILMDYSVIVVLLGSSVLHRLLSSMEFSSRISKLNAEPLR